MSGGNSCAQIVIKHMRILITGGSGFIGTNYVDYVLKFGDVELINLSLHEPRDRSHLRFWRRCDLLNTTKLRETIEEFQPTHVVHLAAKTGVSTDLSTFRANVEGTRKLIDVLRRLSSVERVIFTSSTLVCRLGYIPKHDTDYCPSTAYGQSKMEMERLVRANEDLPFTWTIVRPVYIWGPWSELPLSNLLFKAISQGWYFHIDSSQYNKSLKSLGYVGNTAHQLYKILTAPVDKIHGKTMYLADPPVTLWEFAELIREELGARKIHHMPIGVARLLAIVGDFLKACGWHSVPISSLRLNNILMEYVYPLEPIMEIAAPLPYDVRTAIKQTIQWMRHQNKQESPA